MKTIKFLLLCFLFMGAFLPVSYAEIEKVFKLAPDESHNLNLSLIDDDTKNPFGKYEELMLKKNPNTIFQKHQNELNVGDINIEVKDVIEIKNDHYEIGGKATVSINSNQHTFDFQNQQLTAIKLSSKETLYLYDIDTKYNDQLATIFAAFLTSEDKKYASITIGELGPDGITGFEFGERFVTPEFWKKVEESYTKHGKDTEQLEASDEKKSTLSNIDWGEYNYKATVDSRYFDDDQYVDRSVVLSVGVKYSEDCLCGEVALRAFAPEENIENETNNPYVMANKIKMGVRHHDGQVNQIYPLESSSTSNTIIYDMLSLYGIPTNTIQALANGFNSSISHIDGNSGQPQDMAIEFSRLLGLSNSVKIPADVATTSVEEEYDGIQKGATAYFNVQNYSQNSMLRSYAQVRYNAQALNGQFYNYWSQVAYYRHYMYGL